MLFFIFSVDVVGNFVVVVGCVDVVVDVVCGGGVVVVGCCWLCNWCC